PLVPPLCSSSSTFRPPPGPALFPYTTLFRSGREQGQDHLHRAPDARGHERLDEHADDAGAEHDEDRGEVEPVDRGGHEGVVHDSDRKSTRLNSSHVKISYAVFCLKKKTKKPK